MKTDHTAQLLSKLQAEHEVKLAEELKAVLQQSQLQEQSEENQRHRAHARLQQFVDGQQLEVDAQHEKDQALEQQAAHTAALDDVAGERGGNIAADMVMDPAQMAGAAAKRGGLPVNTVMP